MLRMETVNPMSHLVLVGTLISPSTVDHNNFLEPMIILIMKNNVGHINFQPTKKLLENKCEPN